MKQIWNMRNGKKDEFTEYLESSGVVDNLTEVLVNLYEEQEKPKFPTDFIKLNLKSSDEGENSIIKRNNEMREEIKKLRQKVGELERTVNLAMQQNFSEEYIDAIALKRM